MDYQTIQLRPRATIVAIPSMPLKTTVKRDSTTLPPKIKTPDFAIVAQSRMNLRRALSRACKTKQQQQQLQREKSERPRRYLLPQDINIDVPMISGSATSARQRLPRKTKPQVRPFHEGDAMEFITYRQPGKMQKTPRQASSTFKLRGKKCTVPQPALSPAPAPVPAVDERLQPELQEKRVLASEYAQAEFLGLFGLYTHDVVNRLPQRQSKRKRCTAQNVYYGHQRHKKLKDEPKSAAAAVQNNTALQVEGHLNGGKKVIGNAKCMECKITENIFTICATCRGKYHEEPKEIKKTGRSV